MLSNLFDHVTAAVFLACGAVIVHGLGVGREYETLFNVVTMAIVLLIIAVLFIGLYDFIMGLLTAAYRRSRKVHKQPRHTVRPTRNGRKVG